MLQPHFKPLLMAISLLAALSLAATGSSVLAQEFVSGVEDLPLMPGLTEADEGSLVFETAGGRYVESYAVGDVRPADITGFYGRTLPQLGWSQAGPTLFRRDGEILLIEYLTSTGDGAPLTVRFALSPEEN